MYVCLNSANLMVCGRYLTDMMILFMLCSLLPKQTLTLEEVVVSLPIFDSIHRVEHCAHTPSIIRSKLVWLIQTDISSKA